MTKRPYQTGKIFFFYKHMNGKLWYETERKYSQSVQSLSSVNVLLFATPWTAAWQASLSIANLWGLLKLTSIKRKYRFNWIYNLDFHNYNKIILSSNI